MENLTQQVRNLYRQNKFYTWNRCIEIIAKRHNVSTRKLRIELESQRQQYLCKSGQARSGKSSFERKVSAKPEEKFHRNDLGDIPE